MEEFMVCEELVLFEPWIAFEKRWFNLTRKKIVGLENEKKNVDRRRNKETGRFEKKR